MPDPLVYVRDGSGWIGEGAVTRLDLPGDGFAAADAAWRGAPGGAPVAFGSFPFDPASDAGAVLLVPERARRVEGGLPRLGRAPLPTATVRQGAMSAQAYRSAVAAVAADVRAGRLVKAVLARDVLVSPDGPVDAGSLLDALAAADPGSAVFGVDGLVGASPETLVSVRRGVVTARVLAGTAAPAGARALLESAKDLREHEVAVASLVDALAPRVDGLAVDGPRLLRMPHLVHLATDVSARIADGSSVLEIVAAVHPTAAVAGTPTAAALARIRELEPADRGRYAGPVGWVDRAGDGDWSIAIRSARLLSDGSLNAFAGAGIMADSDPDAELAETRLKLGPILRPFGLGDAAV